jgi:hypothetical protein
MRCEWEAIFEVSPEVKELGIIEGYHFLLDEEKRRCVKIQFSTDSYTQKLPDRSHDYEYAEDTICKQHIEKIKRLLLIRMIYREHFEPINISILRKPFLINREELKQAGVEFKRMLMQTFTVGLGSVKAGDSLLEALAFCSQRARLETKDDDVLKISRWLEWCESAPGEVEKFRILWAAFNSLFTIIAELEGKPKENEKEKIKLSIGKLISSKEAEELTAPFKKNGIIDKLIFLNIVSKYGENFSSDLSDAAKPNKPDWLLLLKKSVLCVYGIRNAIFHDGPRVDDIEQKAAAARELLSPVVRRCLHKMATTDMG